MPLIKSSFLLLMITTLSFNLFSQTQKEFLTNWKKVEEFEKKGLTKSALQEVMTIYQLAIKDNNAAQQIKSSMYQIKYRNMVEEDSQENNVFFADTLIAKANNPVKNILQSMQAEMFWNYLQNNRYKLYNRTKIAVEKSHDINTWSLDKLHSTIATLYKSSLKNDDLLKQTTLNEYEPIIVKGENSRPLRLTLFDFLGHRALQYFVNNERDLTKPAYKFIINNSNAFSPAAEFVTAKFITKDTVSLQYNALILFQQIIKFHLKDINTNALLDADLIRLNFVNQYAVNENKEALYEAALKNIEATYKDNSGIAQAMYLRANIYYVRGQNYQPLINTENQYEIKRAKEICEEVIKKFPNTEGYANCANLLNSILTPALNLISEKVNVPDLPFRTLVNYKNAKEIYFRIIKTSKQDLKKVETGNGNDAYWKEIVSLKSMRNWSVSIPDLQDYQSHSVEIKIDALPIGMYYILASLDENFALQKNIIAKQLIYQSNISFVHNSNNEYNVLHRESGQPLANTQVQVWQTNYNYTSNSADETKAENYTTDKNGYFKLQDSKEFRNFLLQLTYKNDELFMDENNYANNYNTYEETLKPTTFLFTDRSIYRPGQIVYFKGIVLQKGLKNTETAVLNNFKSTVILKDVNGQKVSDLQMVTNEYGSYNGSFKLPAGLLNGQFSLFDAATVTTHFFSVEEYKRPKFFAEILQPTGTYRLLDSITVTGNAKAYAGNVINGATVKYRVTRKVRYPIWWGFNYSRKMMPPGRSGDEMEITNGEINTDANGAFKLTFKAIPDESINKASQPIFNYEVQVDITDLNGETRSAETSVAVAYQALQLKIELPEKINSDSLKNIKIVTTNINNIFEKAIVNVAIIKVQAPNKIFRDRYWAMPDQFVMSKDEYQGYFPYDIYKDEDQINKWNLSEKVIDKTDTTNINGRFPLSNNLLSSGWYKIIATTKDKYGEEVKAEKFVFIQYKKNDILTNDIKEAVTITVEQNKVEPGSKIKYSINTGFDNILLLQTISKMDKSNTITYKNISANQPLINVIDVSETDRGGIAMSYIFVKHNQVYKGNENFNIPWNNKELNIVYKTFRDKTLPGSAEKLTATITGSKGEKVAAEMLVSMYDASLDAFKPQNWKPINIWPTLYNISTWSYNGFAAVSSQEYNKIGNNYVTTIAKYYDKLLPIFTYNRNVRISLRGNVSYDSKIVQSEMASAKVQSMDGNARLDEVVVVGYGTKKENEKVFDSISSKNKNNNNKEAQVQIRKNFNETAFFFPSLLTDADGNVSFSFTIPEALTQWKLMTFAHTKNIASGYTEKTIITQKPLMVQPNAPRFMREGDRMEFSAKIVNLSDKELTGTAQLELLDAATNKPIDGWFKNVFPNQYFTVGAGKSVAVKFPIEIPFNFNAALSYRIIAKSSNKSVNENGGFSDGEEAAIPILTNRMLVTETMPLNIRNTNKKNFQFDKLINSINSNSITNHALTVEFTSSPIWYAVQALPSLMEYPYECGEQIFNSYYANILATYITNSMPKIKTVFEKWKTLDTAALMSNLQKNEDLKSALLQETPWVLAAQNESQQKKNIALLFDMVKMSGETEKAINKLKEMQSPGGGFVWFKGGPDDRYMTQYIMTGIGHLKKLNALSPDEYKKISAMVNSALAYLDRKIKADYDDLIKYKSNLKNNNLGYISIQYLYMRSFFIETPVPTSSKIAHDYFLAQAKKYWLNNGKSMQAMIALALHRYSDINTPKAIIKSLKENAIIKDEMGMYWKEWTTGGYYWHQAPIESQALMIEAFTDIDNNINTINDLKTWLLKQKQTQSWKTTKATADACYALLLNGSNWLNDESEVVINLGNTVIKSTDDKTEAGTGYFKKTIKSENVKPAMGNISVAINNANGKNNTSGSWGAIYWQYFEDLDKITPAATPLQLDKKLFVEKNSANGPVLQALSDDANLKVGDKVKVRIVLKVDRDMEYVHMKDMRAACMEPINVISAYKYQGGLGYYESTKDASTNFFFNWLARGTYVFEYTLFVTHAGNFSNGISTIQCMYAPEFTSHSEGIRVSVNEL